MFVTSARHRAALDRNVELARRAMVEAQRADSAHEEVRWLRTQLALAYAAFTAKPETVVAGTPVVALERKGPDIVAQAITNIAGTNSRLRAHLWHYANGQRAAQLKDDAIAQSILEWQDADDDDESQAESMTG